METLYNYELPKNLIATQPASPRDAARLFVYDTATNMITFDTFLHLDRYLPEQALLVMNNTKVVPARAMLKKETGGKIEVLFLVNEWQGKGPIPALVDRKIVPGATIFFDAKHALDVVRQDENIFYLMPRFPSRKIFELLDRKGITPIPKYIKHAGISETELRRRYQSVFGKTPASVAAPTASLHFTPRVFGKLEQQNIQKAFVTLHVGLGTFAPVTEESVKQGILHSEFLTIPQKTINAIRDHKKNDRPIVAVGTTVVRTLESQAVKILSKKTGDITDSTTIFIRPPYTFKIVDALITNFHLPETSLMMLVEAFLQNKHAQKNVSELYKIAIAEKFHFYSFGDAMLIT
jgi:S-adenosylmethionine:tRNA ribosyltransferase-isomerase